LESFRFFFFVGDVVTGVG